MSTTAVARAYKPSYSVTSGIEGFSCISIEFVTKRAGDLLVFFFSTSEDDKRDPRRINISPLLEECKCPRPYAGFVVTHGGKLLRVLYEFNAVGQDYLEKQERDLLYPPMHQLARRVGAIVAARDTEHKRDPQTNYVSRRITAPGTSDTPEPQLVHAHGSVW